MQIDIRGVIVPNDDKPVYDWFGIEAVSPADVRQALDASGLDPVDVYINSPGGDVSSGSEIYAQLQELGARLRIHITGQACSAASVIACAGYCDMARTAMLMIHNVHSCAQGDTHAMQHEAQVLATANRAIAAAYVAKTGKPEKELLKAMDTETWLTAQDALEWGFIDAIAEPAGVQLAAAAGDMLAPDVVQRVRGMLAGDRARRTAQTRLNFLRLKNKI